VPVCKVLTSPPELREEIGDWRQLGLLSNVSGFRGFGTGEMLVCHVGIGVLDDQRFGLLISDELDDW
jgi:hypothetical protein